MSHTILEFEGLEKSFFGIRVLHNISFSLQEGAVLGLIGENGAGKTTLMNILGGVIQADAGQIKLADSPYAPHNPAEATASGVAFIHQELNLFTNLSIAENIFINGFPRFARLPFINRRNITAQTKDILKSVELELAPDTPVEKLSPGERQLVEIAKALSTDARIIIFDEPTTSLTARETERLFGIIERLRQAGKSVIYISHILNDVLRLTDEIVVLRDGEITGIGPTSEFTINRMISLMVGRDIAQLYPPRDVQPSDKQVLEVKGLSKAGIVEQISFALHQHEVLGVFGLMGSGRTELARILFGLDGFEQGEVCIDGKPLQRFSPQRSIEQKMAFITENRREEGLLMNISITENIGLVSLPDFAHTPIQIIDQRRMYDAVRDVSSSLRIRAGGTLEKQPVKSLSGGNQQKTVIGKWLMAKPSILIMDEPTRGVDVGAKSEIYGIVNDFAARGAGVLFISSELEELIGVCDRIMVMSNGEVQGCFSRSDFDKERILRAAFRENGV